VLVEGRELKSNFENEGFGWMTPGRARVATNLIIGRPGIFLSPGLFTVVLESEFRVIPASRR
jgi:hypothetical protein